MNRCSENLKGFLAQVEAKAGQEKGQLAEEFQEIKARATAYRQQQSISTEAGSNKENIKKNRYKDILPYDQTRVVLNLLTEEGQTDYINANFIQGVDNKRCYIATQGPLPHTVLDFWRMVWQYRMKKKCEKYWPSAEETLQFGPFSVTQTMQQELNPDVILRVLTVTFQKEERVVSHFQYVAWPDRGIPDTYGYFLDMIEQVRCKQGEDTAPICVHCSAGCGRTGVICTLEYIRQLLLKQEQYEFVYYAVVEMFRACLSVCNPNYENLKENRLPLYDDALSLRRSAVPLLKRSTILRSISVPSDPSPAARPELPPKLVRDMGDTYAVVNKVRRSGAGASPVSETKPDGDTSLYAAVKPRSSNVPDTAAIDPSAFVGVQGSHSLPGSPIRHASPSTACEYAHINPSVPGFVIFSCEERVQLPHWKAKGTKRSSCRMEPSVGSTTGRKGEKKDTASAMEQYRLNELQRVHPDLREWTCNEHLTPPRIKTEQLQALHAQTAQQEERNNNSAGEAGILQQESFSFRLGKLKQYIPLHQIMWF
ncbi:hypothetical protein lerEdw1_005497 [Lerista edwardsae]|nr:hypothetical protein lerEdw1_005497 [Lerista edwardsae]